MKWKLVVFDLDGTLIDTIEDLGQAVNYALSSRDLPVHEIDEYTAMVGGGVRNLVWKALPEQHKEDDQLLDELLAVFMEYYTANIDRCTRPYAGVGELLAELQAQGVGMAVASNKFQSGVQALLQSIFPDIRFRSIYGGRPGVPLKPDPTVVNEIIADSGLDAGQVVMVGDSGTDTRTAAAAGIESIAVLWGFNPASAQKGASYVASDCEQLRALLLD